MSNLVILFIHFLATLARLLGPGGVRSIVAESLILKHQLLIVARSRQRSPNLCTSDRILAGLMALLVRLTRLLRSAIVLKPSTLLGLHKALSKQKYRVLFSPNRRRKPGPKGPGAELIRAVVEMKQRNPNRSCPRIAPLPRFPSATYREHRTRTIGPGEGSPPAFGIAKTAFSLRKMARPERLELPTPCFEAVRTTLPNLARGVANRTDSASWNKFLQTTFSFIYLHLRHICCCFPQFALHFRDS